MPLTKLDIIFSYFLGEDCQQVQLHEGYEICRRMKTILIGYMRVAHRNFDLKFLLLLASLSAFI